MFQIIGSFINSLIFIVGGIFLFTQFKGGNKPYLKWLAIVMVAMGILLTIMEIRDMINN